MARSTFWSEEPEPHALFLKRRARKIGWFSTAGQFATMVLVRLGKKRFAARIDRIVAENTLEQEPRPEHRVTEIGSVNAPAFLEAIKRIDPKVVLLAGCRIMKPGRSRSDRLPGAELPRRHQPAVPRRQRRLLGAGLRRPENFGTTVHLVDAGVDTGGILYQARGKPAPDDNIMTYAHRQAAMSRDMCVRAVGDALEGRLAVVPNDAPSRQWYHPPIWQYWRRDFSAASGEAQLGAARKPPRPPQGVGIDGAVPGRVTEMPATAQPKRTASQRRRCRATGRRRSRH